MKEINLRDLVKINCYEERKDKLLIVSYENIFNQTQILDVMCISILETTRIIHSMHKEYDIRLKYYKGITGKISDSVYVIKNTKKQNSYIVQELEFTGYTINSRDHYPQILASFPRLLSKLIPCKNKLINIKPENMFYNVSKERLLFFNYEKNDSNILEGFTKNNPPMILSPFELKSLNENSKINIHNNKFSLLVIFIGFITPGFLEKYLNRIFQISKLNNINTYNEIGIIFSFLDIKIDNYNYHRVNSFDSLYFILMKKAIKKYIELRINLINTNLHKKHEIYINDFENQLENVREKVKNIKNTFLEYLGNCLPNTK